jgi:transposase
MRRVIGMDVHRTFAEVVVWENGRLRRLGRVDMTRSGLEGFGRTLASTDEVVVEATGNAMAVVRVLSAYVARVIMANPLQVKAIAHARIKTDKIDAGVLAQLRRRSGGGGWSRGATKSSGTGLGSRTRCTPSCMHI